MSLHSDTLIYRIEPINFFKSRHQQFQKSSNIVRSENSCNVVYLKGKLKFIATSISTSSKYKPFQQVKKYTSGEGENVN